MERISTREQKSSLSLNIPTLPNIYEHSVLYATVRKESSVTSGQRERRLKWKI